MTKVVLFIFFLLILQGSTSASQKEIQYTGKLDEQLTTDRATSPVKCTVATAEDKSKLPSSVSKDDQVFVSELKWLHYKKPGHKLFLIQNARKPSYIFVDLDQNGNFSSDEQFSFSAVENAKDSEGEVVIHFAMPYSPYKKYPVRLQLNKADQEQKKNGVRHIFRSFVTFTTGSVEVQGRKYLVRYEVNSETGKASGRDGYLGMDSNGDGKIDMSFVSSESTYARDEAVVFRVGEHFLSTKSVDCERGIFILKEHPASDYKRIELQLGLEIPDFAFTDFSGKARKLSEFRGKFLLLDFWGTWCGPCVNEIPNLKLAYEKYQSQGFEILGMDQDKELDQVKKFAAERGITWTNATTESINELIEQRFRITAFPTTILLDPKGKIISLGRKEQLPLKGKELLNTLEKLLRGQ
jgi:thiol-disulfide isomerase/thioredoxin